MNTLSRIYGIRLTRRENEVHSLIAEGLSSRQIAARLCISYYTVANHRKSILQKKGVRYIREIAGLM